MYPMRAASAKTQAREGSFVAELRQVRRLRLALLSVCGVLFLFSIYAKLPIASSGKVRTKIPFGVSKIWTDTESPKLPGVQRLVMDAAVPATPPPSVLEKTRLRLQHHDLALPRRTPALGSNCFRPPSCTQSSRCFGVASAIPHFSFDD